MAISRKDYHMLMHALVDHISAADAGDDFTDAIHMMMSVSYDVQTRKGRVKRIDITDFLADKMGDHWEAMNELGIERMEFVTIYIGDNKILETGSLAGTKNGMQVVEDFENLPPETMRSFAKWTTIAMRDHDIDIMKRLGMPDQGDMIAEGFGALIQEFLDEELEETVTDFQRKLDAVFGVGDLLPAANWQPPEGGEKDDMPPPE